MANVITRRSFLKASARTATATALASMVNIPQFLQQALADGNIGISGKKLLFIFLRGGNDGLNNLIPIQDPSYAANRFQIGLPKDPAAFYDASTGQCDTPGMLQPYAIRAGNGFAALNPNLYDLAPLFNTGRLALIHRVAYRSQSRSHFDSEKYWEKGGDGTTAGKAIPSGMFYRAIVESGWNQSHPLSGVSFQSNLPQSLRGEQPMTNLSSVNRYNILGVSGATSSMNGVNVAADRLKLLNQIDTANSWPYAAKDNRSLVTGLGNAFRDTLDIFQDPSFATNEFYDDNGTTHLFPVSAATNGAGVDSGGYSYFEKLKAAAQVLANTDAVIAGTEMGGFDNHTSQVTTGSPHLGTHARLLKRIGWTFHALAKFFQSYSPTVKWEDVVVVTMSEFGRTSAENDSVGTDHAEASLMYVAGGSVHGGIYGCSPAPLNGINQWDPGTGGKNGSMFQANSNVGYLRRCFDYRSIMGEIIRDHLGATDDQLARIIPAYASEDTEHLKLGGTVGSTPIIGEIGLV